MWKGKTRGGVSGYLFFIYLIRYCGVKAAYGFLSLIVLYFIPFAPKATKSIWQYARRILNRNRIQSVGLLLNNYYLLGQILIDKVAIGNGMIDKYHFKFNHYQEFLNVLDGDQGVIMIGAHVGNWEIGTPFFNDYSKKMNVVMYDAEHQKIKEILKKNGQQILQKASSCAPTFCGRSHTICARRFAPFRVMRTRFCITETAWMKQPSSRSIKIFMTIPNG